MSSAPQTQEFISLRSEYATGVDHDTSTYTFDLGSNFNATRMTLGSVEFPMSQTAIRKGRDMLYVSNGVRVTSGTFEVFACDNADDSSSAVVSVDIPLFRNNATVCSLPCGLVRVTTYEAHGIASAMHRDAIETGETGETGGSGEPSKATPFLICNTEGGRVDIESAHVDVVDRYTFTLNASVREGAAMLCTHAFDSPSELCAAVSRALRYAMQNTMQNAMQSDGRVHCTTPFPVFSFHLLYDEKENVCELSVSSLTTHPGAPPSPRFIILGGLASMLKLNRVRGSRSLKGGKLDGWMMPVQAQHRWYAPCHRSITCSAPPRLSNELEFQLNRLTFAESPRLVFVDPTGMHCEAPFPAGRYTRHSIALAITSAVNASLSAAFKAVGGVMEVKIHRQGFAIGVAWSLPIEPTVTLLFSKSGDVGMRLGFESPVYSNKSTHYSDSAFSAAETSDGRALTSYVRVAEDSARKRFIFDPLSAPVMTATCEPLSDHCHTGYNGDIGRVGGNGQKMVKLVTTREDSAYSPGFQSGDILVLASDSWVHGVQGMQGVQGVQDGQGESARRVQVVHCVVVRSGGDETIVFCPCTLTENSAKVWSAHMDPLCISTSLPESIDSTLLGIGCMLKGTGRLQTPSNYNLDHVDYVTLEVTGEVATDSSFTHMEERGQQRQIFTKVIFTPVFKEERMVLKDISLSGKVRCMSIRFANPDGSAYQFNGASFGMTIALICNTRHG